MNNIESAFNTLITQVKAEGATADLTVVTTKLEEAREWYLKTHAVQNQRNAS